MNPARFARLLALAVGRLDFGAGLGLVLLPAGGFGAVAIGRGWLSPAWASVPKTDFLLVDIQRWLVLQLPHHDVRNTSSPV